MSLTKTLPIITSIAIILLVAYVRQRSRTAAVIFGTMPVNLPLALWVTFAGSGASAEQMSSFTRALLWGLVATFLWLLVVWFMVRSGWGLLAAIGAGYVLWGGLLLVMFRLGMMSVAR